MPTPEQIDEQVKLEREAISCGLKRLQDQTIKLEDQSYASATIYGISSIDTLPPLLVERIEKTRVRIHKGSNQAIKVCESIGRAVEDECQMRHYEKCAPGLLNTLKENYWHRAIGTHQKLVVIRTLMNRYDVKQWISW